MAVEVVSPRSIAPAPSAACDRDAGAFASNAFSLSFSNPPVERAFLETRLRKLYVNIIRIQLVLSAVCLPSFLAGFSTGGWTFRTEHRSTSVWIDSTCSAFFILSGPTVAALARVPGIERRMGFHECEAFVVSLSIALVVWQILTFLTSDLQFGLSSLALALDAVVTVQHLAMPVRWCIVLWTDVLIVAGYALCVVMKPEGDVQSNLWVLMVFVGLVVGASLGTRSQELTERKLFSTVADERTLRAQAEFKLRTASPSAKAQSPPDDVASAATSTVTSTAFAGIFQRLDTNPSLAQSELNSLGKQEHWLIKQEELKVDFMKVLGRGGFGLVVRGAFCCTAVAVKLFPTSPTGSAGPVRTDMSSVLSELRVLRYVRHPNIVLFHGACLHTGSDGITDIRLVLEMVDGETLKVYIRKRMAEMHSPPHSSTRKQIMEGVCQALVYLHTRSPPIVHADLKPSNIMVERPGGSPSPKLLDFGLSRVVSRKGTRIPGGTKGFVAPEIVQGRGQNGSPAVDIFAMGQLLHYVSTGHLDFDADPSCLTGALLIQDWHSTISACVQEDPLERPTAEEVHRQLFGGASREESESLSAPAAATREARVQGTARCLPSVSL